MEIRIVLRGAISGFVAGVLGFILARIFAEPLVGKAIAYEGQRDDAITAIAKAAGVAIDPDGPEYFSRTAQSTWGLATGIIAFSTAMGALVAVAYLVLHGRFNIRPRTLALLISGFGFLGIYLLPFCKYPANPPSIGHTFTIATRTALYLTVVAGSLIFLGLGVWLGRRLKARFGVFNATLIAAAAVIVAYGILVGLLPSLGHLAANKRVAGSIGYGSSATETPLPVINHQGQIVLPGFSADLLWKFRFWSLVEQILVWASIGLIFSTLVERFFRPTAKRPSPPATTPAPAPVSV
ncbi:MAG: rane protein [Mycobacterium sp.]|nr:rane protein [Mycobacterium sp.]